MEKIALIVQLVSSVLLIVLVLIQQRGATLDQAFGGSGTFFADRRGVEKTLFSFTVITAVVFVLASLAHLFIR
jgi:protein translocase SecG subunit